MTGLLIPVILGIPALTCACLWTASIRRGNTLFGLSSDPGWLDSPDAARTVWTYRMQLLFWTACSIALGFANVFSLFPLLVTAGGMGAILLARRRVRRMEPAQSAPRSASLRPDSGTSPLFLAAMIMPFVILSAAVLWLHMHYEAIPARFAVHWNASGHANGWAHKSTRGVYGPLLFGAALTALMDGIALFILRYTPRSPKSARLPTARLFVRMACVIAMMMSGIAINRALPLGIAPGVLAAGSLAAIGTLIVLFLRSVDMSGGGGTTPERAWTLGMFYSNPADPSLVVERRMGFGYTLNFGHAVSWLLMAAAVAVPLAAVILLRA